VPSYAEHVDNLVQHLLKSQRYMGLHYSGPAMFTDGDPDECADEQPDKLPNAQSYELPDE
jgi:hypothetical protein